jgi:hypothetical protein
MQRRKVEVSSKDPGFASSRLGANPLRQIRFSAGMAESRISVNSATDGQDELRPRIVERLPEDVVPFGLFVASWCIPGQDAGKKFANAVPHSCSTLITASVTFFTPRE